MKKENGQEKKGGVKPSLKIVIKEDKLFANHKIWSPIVLFRPLEHWK